MSGLLTRIREWLGTTADPSEEGETPQIATDGSGGTVDPPEERQTVPAECCSKSDVLMELGMTPEAYLRRMVESAGGRLKQQRITERTGWSAATVSRTLSEMEEEGIIERARVGQGKVVYLPSAGPDGSASMAQSGTDAAKEKAVS